MADVDEPRMIQPEAFRRDTIALVAPTTQLKLRLNGRRHKVATSGFDGGDLRLGITVPGYWGDEQVRVVWKSEDPEPDIAYPSGGFERGYSDIKRARNFAFAMTFAANVAEQWVADGFDATFDREFDAADDKVSPR